MIRKHQLPRVFPENVLAEARDVALLMTIEVDRRRDFRGLPIVTIDGETARDFDDAVLVTRSRRRAALNSRFTSPTWPNTWRRNGSRS